jgi:hypothetical protein
MKKLIIATALTAGLISTHSNANTWKHTKEVKCSATYFYTADGKTKTFTNTTTTDTEYNFSKVCKGYKAIAKKVGKRLKSRKLGYVGVQELKCKRESTSGFMWLGRDYDDKYENCPKTLFTKFDRIVNKIIK